MAEPVEKQWHNQKLTHAHNTASSRLGDAHIFLIHNHHLSLPAFPP